MTTDPVFRLMGTEEELYRADIHFHFDLTPTGSVILSQPGVVGGATSRIQVILNFDAYAARLVGASS